MPLCHCRRKASSTPQHLHTPMADCPYALFCAMDFFWFHHNILAPNPVTPLHGKSILELANPSAELLVSDPELISETLCASPPSTQEAEIDCTKKRPSSSEFMGEDEVRSSDGGSRAGSPSSSSSAYFVKHQGTKGHRKGKIRSSKSLSELESDELKGFIDLGFVFKKDDLNPRMLCMIPGLQRVDGGKGQRSVEERVRDKITRPYLSEAWLINRPDSPLLNLRIQRVATAGSDMKKHLRFWARTVASEIQQES